MGHPAKGNGERSIQLSLRPERDCGRRPHDDELGRPFRLSVLTWAINMQWLIGNIYQPLDAGDPVHCWSRPEPRKGPPINKHSLSRKHARGFLKRAPLSISPIHCSRRSMPARSMPGGVSECQESSETPRGLSAWRIDAMAESLLEEFQALPLLLLATGDHSATPKGRLAEWFAVGGIPWQGTRIRKDNSFESRQEIPLHKPTAASPVLNRRSSWKS
jgi:hypothetical protein